MSVTFTASIGATEINVFSTDTDVFVLLLRRYYELCTEVHFVTGTGQRRRVIKLPPIAQTLGRSRVAALAALLTRGSSLGGKCSKMPMRQPLMPYPNSEQEAYQQQTPWLPSKSWCVDYMFPTPQLKPLGSYDGHCSARRKHNLRNYLLHKRQFARPL